jgi:hypothetical protein
MVLTATATGDPDGIATPNGCDGRKAELLR